MENEIKVGNTVKFKRTDEMKVVTVEKGKATCEWKINGETKSLLVPVELLRLIDDDKYKYFPVIIDRLM